MARAKTPYISVTSKDAEIFRDALKTRVGSMREAKREAMRVWEEMCAKVAEEKAAVREMVSGFVRETMVMFLGDMGTWKREKYIRGGYTSEFTRHVERNVFGSWRRGWRRPESSHCDAYFIAVHEYNTAAIKLKTAFVTALEESEEFREAIIENSSIKNVARIGEPLRMSAEEKYRAQVKHPHDVFWPTDDRLD